VKRNNAYNRGDNPRGCKRGLVEHSLPIFPPNPSLGGQSAVGMGRQVGSATVAWQAWSGAPVMGVAEGQGRSGQVGALTDASTIKF
jgi:hypothetical protein